MGDPDQGVMVYEPLHHKYRPQRFADVVGQAAVVKTLTHAIQLGRIAPAYLFCGPRGTGKTSSARILAKSLNCERGGPTADPCQVCQQCRSITHGSSLDVIEIDAASNTGVDKIRELIERAQFAPVSSRYKVYVLDEVHMLSSAAFNALLKTLEEPPPQVVFVLATTDPQRVLPTVISRCQRFDYRRIPLTDMLAHLTQIAQQEGIPIASAALELIAQLSQGGLRDAESLLDQLSLLEGEIDLEAVWNLVGAVPERALLSLIDAIQSRDPLPVITLTRHLLDHGKEPLTLLQNLVSFYRDLLLAKTAPNRRDMVALTPDTWAALQTRAEHYSISHVLALQSHLRQAEIQIRQSGQPRLWLEISLMELLQAASASAPPTELALPQMPPPAPLPSPPPLAPPSVAPSPPSMPDPPAVVVKPVLSPSPPAAADPLPSPPPVGSLGSQWEIFLQRLTPVAKGRVRLGRVIQETPQEITLGFPNQGFADMARAKLSDIQPIVNEVVGRTVRLIFTVDVATLAPPTDSPPPPPPAAASSGIPLSPPLPQGSPTAAPLATPASPPSAPLPEPDELQETARRLAEFFHGSVVSMSPGDPQPAATPLNSAPPTPEEEDLPF
ncbi:MAG: DNA polymerase III subunit gamma/tau [Cyanobacteriota bacterium]|nr:DNA polymerase III subunit gamma/tau [Cyanobacteriota bacterium]